MWQIFLKSTFKSTYFIISLNRLKPLQQDLLPCKSFGLMSLGWFSMCPIRHKRASQNILPVLWFAGSFIIIWKHWIYNLKWQMHDRNDLVTKIIIIDDKSVIFIELKDAWMKNETLVWFSLCISWWRAMSYMFFIDPFKPYRFWTEGMP